MTSTNDALSFLVGLANAKAAAAASSASTSEKWDTQQQDQQPSQSISMQESTLANLIFFDERYDDGVSVSQDEINRQRQMQRELGKLQFVNPGGLMTQPTNTRRSRRKINEDKETTQEKRHIFHDKKGKLIVPGEESITLCDCLIPECHGCHWPCGNCGDLTIQDLNLMSLRTFTIFNDWPIIASMSDEQFDSFLADRGLLWRNRQCPNCNQPRRLTSQSSVGNQDVRLKFECNRASCRKPGIKRKIGYLVDTFFEKLRGNRKKIFLASYFFIHDMGTVEERARSCDVNRSTIVNWDQWFREVLVESSLIKKKNGSTTTLEKLDHHSLKSTWSWQTATESRFYLLWAAIAKLYPIRNRN